MSLPEELVSVSSNEASRSFESVREFPPVHHITGCATATEFVLQNLLPLFTKILFWGCGLLSQK